MSYNAKTDAINFPFEDTAEPFAEMKPEDVRIAARKAATFCSGNAKKKFQAAMEAGTKAAEKALRKDLIPTAAQVQAWLSR